eukprot:jgi/Ulvmu1/8284/UM041_0096.1
MERLFQALVLLTLTLRAASKDDEQCDAMFAAVAKGHGKGQLATILGARKIKNMCDELEQNNSFACKKVWATGACGQLLDDNNIEWLPDEITRVAAKLHLEGAAQIQWKSAADVALDETETKKMPGKVDGKKHSWFAQEQKRTLFDRTRFRNPRKLISPERVPQTAAVLPIVIQHDAPLPLASLSAYAGGCIARCNDPRKFIYSHSGEDVTIYIVDGNVADHEEFQDMDTGATRIVEDRHFSYSARRNEGLTCASDHGTHVASLAAGFQAGAAKSANLVSVAVQPGCGMSGYASELEEGLDWVLNRHLAQPEPRKPAVVSMSLIISSRSSASVLIAEKVEELIENGIIVVAAAGNFHDDSCDYIPSGLPGVITVAAADVTHDATMAYPWSWSNYGGCVDVWAPGVDIEAASPDCFECTARYSGTSQATPLVTGLIAQYLSARPDAGAAEIRSALQKHAARHILQVFGHPYDTMTHLFAQTSVEDADQDS